MGRADSTCWLLIEGAAAGCHEDREDFARRYEPVIRAYLGARWRGSGHAADLDDAVQEVFLECYRQGGVLERADPSRPGGFRPFLYAVVRNVALRCETRKARRREGKGTGSAELQTIESRDESLSRVFDRAWAKALVREAFAVLTERAQGGGESAQRRVELLRLHFHEKLTIREVARRWGSDEKSLYREFGRAKDEYRAALMAVVAFHRPGTAGEIERECAELLALV